MPVFLRLAYLRAVMYPDRIELEMSLTLRSHGKDLRLLSFNGCLLFFRKILQVFAMFQLFVRQTIQPLARLLTIITCGRILMVRDKRLTV